MKTTTDCMDEKLTTLRRIAELLNEEGIMWAVGGSLMLFLRGRVKKFHDIDLMVAEEQAEEARALLAQMGTPMPEKPNDRYRTRHYQEFVIYGTDVDLVAGFVIVKDGVAHECPLLPEDITETVDLQGTAIPLHALSTWQHYYTLMGRTEKAALCKA